MSDPIDLLLTESELEHDTGLRDLLGEIQHEATAVRPMPSAELSALMNPRSAAARRPRRRSFAGRSAIITGVVVIGALGLGATAAAASPEARSAIGAGVAAIAHLFQPALVAPEPAPTPRHPASGTDVPSTDPSAGASDGPSADPTADATGEPSPSADATAGANNHSGSSGHSGDSKSEDSHGNGTGNQSGHGNGTGQGNGGPAPTP